MLVAVYGTLKSGYGNNYILSSTTKIADGVVRGFKLYNSGFPVAAHNDGDTAVVEVWDIGDRYDVLRRLDTLEGHYGNDDPSSMYFREEVTVYTDTGSYQCDMYVGNPSFWRGFQGMTTCPQLEDGTYEWSSRRRAA